MAPVAGDSSDEGGDSDDDGDEEEEDEGEEAFVDGEGVGMSDAEAKLVASFMNAGVYCSRVW